MSDHLLKAAAPEAHATFPLALPSAISAPVLEPYAPPVSDMVFDPSRMLERQRELDARELASFITHLPGTIVPGAGPDVFIGLDAEWVHDPLTRTNRILSIQFHVVGEGGEFRYIHYV